jgi:hypothetical protein
MWKFARCVLTLCSLSLVLASCGKAQLHVEVIPATTTTSNTPLANSTIPSTPLIERTQIVCPVALFFKPGLNSDPGYYLDPYYGICPSAASANANAVFQQFENGFMVWEEQTGTIYALNNLGTGIAISSTVYMTYPNVTATSSGTPSVSMNARFARIWNSSETIRNRLGNPALKETQYLAEIQSAPFGGADGQRVFISLPNGSVLDYQTSGAWNIILP